MKKILMFSIILGVMLMSVGVVLATRPNSMPDKARNSFALPENAVEVAPGVFHLGYALDNGRVVEGYAMFVKPVAVCGNGICEPGENINKCPEDCTEDPTEPDTSSCYEFLARGAKWKTVENYIVNPANTRGLGDEFVRSNLANSILKWETEAGTEILGLGSSTINTLVADFDAPDDQNEVYFENLGETNTIAFAVVWGIFGGPPPFRELVEWDMVFNDYYAWGDAEMNPALMDFESIATHELGHAVGLGDLYNDGCSEQTMYGYASYGETKKRTLEAGDIAGVSSLY